MRFKSFALALAGSIVIGCASLKPAPTPAMLGAAPLEGTTLPQGGQWPVTAWWERYQDPTLNKLVETALHDSPTLAAAQSRFDSARESIRVTAAAVGAHVDASAQSSRQRLSDNGLFKPSFLGFNWYNLTDLGLSASYTFDWWGKERASVEAATSEARAAAADRTAAALVLAGAVVDTYFGWQTDQARLVLSAGRIDALSRAAAIADERQRAELDSADLPAQANADLAAARGQQAALAGSAQLRLVALAALTGHSVAQLPPLEAKPLPSLPAALPDRLGLDLLARRPDIAASRARVESAQHRRHVAAAQFYPDLSIHALAGLQSIDLGHLLEAGSADPQIGIAIHLPLFDNGLRRAQLGVADSGIAAAVAAYNDTVIGAAREVAADFVAGSQATAQRAQQLVQVDSAMHLEQSAAARVRQGVTDLRAQLGAQAMLLMQRDALVQLDAAALSADSALQKALGGGFEDSPNSNPRLSDAP
ncbi:MAG: efflux transporter outer membrane subunit [Steroidobacteraceae bacterium]